MEDTNERKWNSGSMPTLHGSSGKEFIIKQEQLDLWKMCRKAKRKAAKTKKYKGTINKNNTKIDSDFVNNADKNGV